jgi:uncharacterized coiled-coil protein SlyX
MDLEQRVAGLEREVAQLKRQMEELTRLLKRVDDENIKRAARRAQNA